MSNETKIKQLENKMKHFESLLNVELKELKEEVEELKQKGPEQEPWPKVGDEVTIVNFLGETDTQTYLHTPFFEHQLKIGNCHRTEEQALRHKEYITSPRVRARELVEMCDGFDPCGNAYILVIDSEVVLNRMTLDSAMYGGLQFKAGGYATDAVLMLGEPLIKVALGVIVGEEAEHIVRETMGMVK